MAVAGDQVWRNGVALQQRTGTSCSDKAIAGGTTYTCAVTSYDAAGNISISSSTAKATAAKTCATKKR